MSLMLRVALAAGLVAVLVAVVAAVDHRHKREVEFAAQEDAWFCAHGRPSACREFDAVSYEEHWERREFGYRISFFALGVSALGLAAIGLRRRHR